MENTMKTVAAAAALAIGLAGYASTAAAAGSEEIRHYRAAFGQRLVCISNRFANYDPCSRSLSLM